MVSALQWLASPFKECQMVDGSHSARSMVSMWSMVAHVLGILLQVDFSEGMKVIFFILLFIDSFWNYAIFIHLAAFSIFSNVKVFLTKYNYSVGAKDINQEWDFSGITLKVCFIFFLKIFSCLISSTKQKEAQFSEGTKFKELTFCFRLNLEYWLNLGDYR